MCGIAGIVSVKPIESNDIKNITSGLRHRGPDAEGIYISSNGTVAVGHTRLSIIDLRSESNQPFFSANGQFVVVFNGEIYNFLRLRNELTKSHGTVFRTNSDTEVIAEAFSVWGTKMVSRLEGMFAIAILDQKINKVYFFRDRAGKKPLYYFQSDHLFAFASEIKSLLQHPVIKNEVRVNNKIISTFLHLGYIPEPFTIYSNIFKFPSGSTGEIGSNLILKSESFWQIQTKIWDESTLSDDVAKNRLLNLLDDAVKMRLISDVPLGAFLSGGTDSSLISAIASKHLSKRLKTFSIGFKESKFDESKYASEVAQKLNTDHIEYVLSEREAVGILETYLKHFDEPFADTSAIPTMLVSQLARKEVTVALTGDGGDELFQGYGAYEWANRLDQGIFQVLRTPLRSVLATSGKSRFQRVSHLFEKVKAGSIRSHIFSQEQYLFTQSEIRDRLLKDKIGFVPFQYEDSVVAGKKLTAGEKQALFDLQYYLKDDLLVKVDRASMFYALECRSPFLDHQIIEYAFSLDYSFKVRDGKTKWILKELLRKFLPDQLVDRPKWGFSVPLEKWLRNDLRYLIDSFLSKETVEDINLFRVSYIERLKRDFFSGQDYLYNRLWLLIVIHKWLKENQ